MLIYETVQIMNTSVITESSQEALLSDMHFSRPFFFCAQNNIVLLEEQLVQFLRFGDTTYLPNRFPVMFDIEKFLLTRLFLCSREAC